ncbi:MAG: Uma2 family endonuclease [Dehalococcoidia bacterium]
MSERLTRAEFERRWDAHPEITRAELIDGVVFRDVSVSPTHAELHLRVGAWLMTFAAFHAAAVQALDNVSVRIPGGHELQPDVALRRPSGGSSEAGRGALDGAPEFVFEVAVTSAARDLGRKKDLYPESGVREYAVWQVEEGLVSWWAARDGAWVAIEPGPDGIVESLEFPGLRLDVTSLLAGDMASVLRAVTPR